MQNLDNMRSCTSCNGRNWQAMCRTCWKSAVQAFYYLIIIIIQKEITPLKIKQSYLVINIQISKLSLREHIIWTLGYNCTRSICVYNDLQVCVAYNIFKNPRTDRRTYGQTEWRLFFLNVSILTTYIGEILSWNGNSKFYHPTR